MFLSPAGLRAWIAVRAALAREPGTPRNLAEAIRRRFRPLGGVELRLPERQPMREPPTPGKGARRRQAE